MITAGTTTVFILFFPTFNVVSFVAARYFKRLKIVHILSLAMLLPIIYLAAALTVIVATCVRLLSRIASICKLEFLAKFLYKSISKIFIPMEMYTTFIDSQIQA